MNKYSLNDEIVKKAFIEEINKIGYYKELDKEAKIKLLYRLGSKARGLTDEMVSLFRKKPHTGYRGGRTPKQVETSISSRKPVNTFDDLVKQVQSERSKNIGPTQKFLRETKFNKPATTTMARQVSTKTPRPQSSTRNFSTRGQKKARKAVQYMNRDPVAQLKRQNMAIQEFVRDSQNLTGQALDNRRREVLALGASPDQLNRALRMSGRSF